MYKIASITDTKHNGGVILKHYKIRHLIFLVMIISIILIPSSVFADFGDTTLKRDMTHPDVIELQQKLKQLGFFTENKLTNFFGSKTEDAVKKFQKSVGITADGTAGSKTLKAIDIKLHTASTSTVSRGDARPELGSTITKYAKEFLGKPYKWGASNEKSFDCSGFTMYIYNNFNIKLGHSAASQFQEGIKIAKANLKQGDAVFFTTYKKGASHVGIFIGDNKFIHASSSGGKVIITDLNTAYYKSRYIGARRYN